MASQLNMEYNSQKDIMKIAEYGRNVHNLIMHCKTIEDKAHQQAFAERIIRLMWQMNPSAGIREDIMRKFWTHLMIISDFELDLEIPEGIEILKPEDVKVDEPLDYPERNRRMRHYGKNVQLMLEKAKTMEDPIKQKAYLRIIGSFMKLAYKNWSREQYINDEAIKNDIRTLTNNELEMPDDLHFDIAPPAQNKRKQNNSNHKRNNRSKGRSSQNRKRRY